MSLDSWQRFFDTSPALRLLRSPHAAWILDFFQQQFKLSGQITHTHSTLCGQLELYLTTIVGRSSSESAKAGEAVPSRGKAEAYLSKWCAGDCGWLKRFIDDNQSEPVYQLTADSEMALAFVLKGTRQSQVIGTQSHLRSILNLLNEVAWSEAAGGNDEASPKRDRLPRIEQLERQRAEIDRQLGQLRGGGRQDARDENQQTSGGPQAVAPAKLDTALVREQFSLAVAQLEQLKGEFRAVEERFKSITRGVQQRLLAADQSRGEILQFALDAEDLLKTGEHGRSFFEFLKLVHDPASQERIGELVQQLMHFEALADSHEELHSLRTMIPTLLGEAEKILRTTQHLSHTLRRLLDSRSTRHHQQLAQVLRDIRAQAAALSQTPPTDITLEIEAEIDVQVPFDRPFWSQSEPFAEVELQLVEDDPHEHAWALEQLVALERIDWQTMRRNVSRVLQRTGESTLTELLQQFPIQTGVVEVLGYLQIAHEDGHWIDASQQIELRADWDGARGRTLRLPQVVFRSKSQSKKVSDTLGPSDFTKV